MVWPSRAHDSHPITSHPSPDTPSTTERRLPPVLLALALALSMHIRLLRLLNRRRRRRRQMLHFLITMATWEVGTYLRAIASTTVLADSNSRAPYLCLTIFQKVSLDLCSEGGEESEVYTMMTAMPTKIQLSVQVMPVQDFMLAWKTRPLQKRTSRHARMRWAL